VNKPQLHLQFEVAFSYQIGTIVRFCTTILIITCASLCKGDTGCDTVHLGTLWLNA